MCSSPLARVNNYVTTRDLPDMHGPNTTFSLYTYMCTCDTDGGGGGVSVASTTITVATDNNVFTSSDRTVVECRAVEPTKSQSD